MPSTFSIANAYGDYGSSPLAHTFFQTLTEGNLMVVQVSNRSGVAMSTLTVSDSHGKPWLYADVESGDVSASDFENVITNPDGRHTIRIAYRLVDADEDGVGNYIITATCSAGGNVSMDYVEVAIPAGWVPSLKTASAQGSGVNSLDGISTSTGSISGSDLLHIFLQSARQGAAIGGFQVSEYAKTTEYVDLERIANTNQISAQIGVVLDGQSVSGVVTVTSDLTGSNTAAAEGIIAQLVFEDASSGGQTITGSDHVDGDTIGAGTVTPGAVGITGADHVDPDSFGAGTISQGAVVTGAAHDDADSFGSGSIGLVLAGVAFADGDSFGVGQLNLALFGSGHDDGDSFGAGTVQPGGVSIAGAGHDNADQFGSGVVSQGGVAITGTAHLDPDAFGSGAVAPGPVQIVGTAHVDPDSFGAGAILSGTVIAGSAHVDLDSFGAGLVSVGTVTIIGTAYADPDGFGAGVVGIEGGPQFISGAGHDDPDAFGGGAVAPGAVGVVGAAHVDPDVFGSGAVSIVIRGTLMVNAQQFGAGEILPGGVFIVGAAHVDPDAFGAGSVADAASLLVVPDERVEVLAYEGRTAILPRESRVNASERT